MSADRNFVPVLKFHYTVYRKGCLVYKQDVFDDYLDRKQKYPTVLGGERSLGFSALDLLMDGVVAQSKDGFA